MASGKIERQNFSNYTWTRVVNGISYDGKATFNMAGRNEILVCVENSGNHYHMIIPKAEVPTSSTVFLNGNNGIRCWHSGDTFTVHNRTNYYTMSAWVR